MNKAEGRRWSKIIGKEADALEASRSSPSVPRTALGRAAVRIILADEIAEIEEVLQQFAEAVASGSVAQATKLASTRTALRINGRA